MKRLLLIMSLFFVQLSFGQEQTNKTVTEQFIKHYNAEQFEEIYNMFSKEMQTALPLEKTQSFLSGLKAQAGSIETYEFNKIENGTYHSYRSKFERALFALNVSINDEFEINGLLVKPFEDESKVREASNSLSESSMPELSEKQRKIIYQLSKDFPENTEMSIAIIKNGEVSFVGIKRMNDAISPTTNYQSIFEIGSITKVFTATLLANLIVDNHVQASDFINDYLSTKLKNDAHLSFEELGTHTSGLPRLPENLDLSTADSTNPYQAYAEEDLEYFLTELLEIPEKSKGNYDYSNLGSGILGYTLSKIEGQSYEDMLNQKIFSRYGMKSSSTEMGKLNGDLVKGLTAEGKETANWTFTALAGAGAILSTTEDLSKFALAQFETTNKELALTRQSRHVINQQLEIGLGWHIVKTKTDDRYIWHNGGTGGYTSSMTLDIENKNGIIVLTNVSAFHPKMQNIDQLGFGLIRTVR